MFSMHVRGNAKAKERNTRKKKGNRRPTRGDKKTKEQRQIGYLLPTWKYAT